MTSRQTLGRPAWKSDQRNLSSGLLFDILSKARVGITVPALRLFRVVRGAMVVFHEA